MQLTDLLVVFYWFIIATVFLRIIFKRRSVSASLAWVLIIVVFPIFGVIIYLFFGEIQLGQKRADRALALRKPFLENYNSHLRGHEPPAPPQQTANAIFQLIHHRDGIGALSYDDFSLLASPDEIFDAWIADINAAQQNIRMEFYIWHPYGRVSEVTEALLAAAKRGVEIELLIDHAGSWRFFTFSAAERVMRDAGIKVVPALPVNLFRNLFRRADIRLHRKLLLIDHQICYTGSMNMADPRFFNANKKFGPWVDMMIRFTGTAAFGVSKVFSWDWELETGQRNFPQLQFPLTESPKRLSIIPSGPGHDEEYMHQIMLSVLHRANSEIFISTPYFVPSDSIYAALCHAAHRGINVTILLPQVSDSKMAAIASQSYFEGLLRAGVKIHLFGNGLLHTKAITVDGELALVGSMNLDMRSLQLNFELSLALYDQDCCDKICELLRHYAEQSEPVSLERWSQRRKYRHLAERFMYFLSPLL
ncbi:cardiolipin synthase [Aliidiomarina haloalkalitolerans]|uniref:cardiolipin synthase n=1 Tax=Aliidiomarina haloalkalitolerans TaxID=859059 RepID=UPI001300B435|nr:cardiolipin synthase [Aliidiomarina haloalkalitolerans]MCL4409661.1 cardiolipin synthase [Gammaproteobacteria bacterium]